MKLIQLEVQYIKIDNSVDHNHHKINNACNLYSVHLCVCVCVVRGVGVCVCVCVCVCLCVCVYECEHVLTALNGLDIIT